MEVVIQRPRLNLEYNDHRDRSHQTERHLHN
jgi:hypothetical protein